MRKPAKLRKTRESPPRRWIVRPPRPTWRERAAVATGLLLAVAGIVFLGVAKPRPAVPPARDVPPPGAATTRPLPPPGKLAPIPPVSPSPPMQALLASRGSSTSRGPQMQGFLASGRGGEPGGRGESPVIRPVPPAPPPSPAPAPAIPDAPAAPGLLADAPWLEGASAIEGRVVEAASGRPVAGAVVSAASAERGAETRTGADGMFRIEALGPGIYAVHAESPAHLPAPPQPIYVDGSGGLAGAVEIALEPGLSIAGRVVGPGGSPVPARVRARPLAGDPAAEAGERAVLTDVDGRFVVAGLGQGAYALEAAALDPGFAEARLGAVPAGATGVRLEAAFVGPAAVR